MRNITALLFVATVPDSGPERLLREQKRVTESITNTARSPSEKSVRDVTHQLLRELCPRLRDDRKRQEGRAFGSTGAAAKLGISRSTLEPKIRSLKIDKIATRLIRELEGLAPPYGIRIHRLYDNKGVLRRSPAFYYKSLKGKQWGP